MKLCDWLAFAVVTALGVALAWRVGLFWSHFLCP